MELDRDALRFGAIVGIIQVIAHTAIHYQFVPQKMFQVGAIQSNLGIFLAGVIGMYGMTVAVEKFEGIKLFGISFILWVLHAVGHDGIHSFYISFEEISKFGFYGVPESGITVAIIQLAGLLYIYTQR